MKFNKKIIVLKRLLLYSGLVYIVVLCLIPIVHANYFQPEFPETLINLVKNLLVNYLFTSIIEMFVIIASYGYSKELALTVLWINLITDPTFQLFVWTFTLVGPFLILILTIIIGEGFSIYLESILLIEKLKTLEIDHKKRRAFRIVIIANLLTIGIAIFPIFLWPPIFLIY